MDQKSRAVRRLAMFGLFFAMLHLVTGSANAGEPLPKGTLSGTVVDPQGKPVAGALVTIDDDDDKRMAEARSDSGGTFRLGPLDPAYRSRPDICVQADGFAIQYVPGKTYSVFPGVDCDLGRIRLDRGTTFAGQVLDDDGKPRLDATVEFQVHRMYLGHTFERIGRARQATVDSDGRFRSPPLSVGRLYLLVRAPERQLAYRDVLIGPQGEEELDPVRMEKDVPISGVVQDEQDAPIVGVKINANTEYTAVSDEEGKFVLRGFGPHPTFQMQAYVPGYVFINWGVKVSDEGFRWHEVGNDHAERVGPVKDLEIIMKRPAFIEGRAVDEQSGEPVRLDKVVRCSFDRKANGEVVLSSCSSAEFDQPEPGRFRIAYSSPDEYHLTLSAAGYHDAEAFTPKVTRLEPITDIIVKLRKQDEGSKSQVARQRIFGAVTRGGQPIKSGWVGLWRVGRQQNQVNAYMLRGRTVAGIPIYSRSSPIRDGRYLLDVPYQGDSWYVVVEQSGEATSQAGPFSIDLNQEKQLDIACADGGSISGHVSDVPEGWEGNLWVVAFTTTGIQAETRVSADGKFSFRQLPAGEYGLKVGHDGYQDSEVPPFDNIPADAWKTMSDPWKRSKIVRLEAGGRAEDVQLELPPE